MAPKKTKQKSPTQPDTYVVLHDNANSTSHVFPQDTLSYSKKDNLKLGSSATYKGNGNLANRFEGTVVMSGTKEMYENALSLIDKAADNGSAHSNRLVIDDRTEHDTSDDGQQSQVEKEPVIIVPITEETGDLGIVHENSINSSRTTFADIQSSSVGQPATTCSSANLALVDITNHPCPSQKRKEINQDFANTAKRLKSASNVSHSQYEKMRRENVHLKKQLNVYKSSWMPKPIGAAATYFVDVGRVLSGKSDDNDAEMEKGELLESICAELNMTEDDLKKCEHTTDITKTCRMLTKHVYRDLEKRASELVSTMNSKTLQAIQNYARLAHPVQARTPNSVLNNAIGNVFAVEKRKLGQLDNEVHDVDEIGEESEIDDSSDEL